MTSLKTLTDLYRAMLRIRRAEERVAQIYPTDKIQSPIHLSIAQEAIAAGVSLALGPDDHLYGTYRGHGLYIARGGALGPLFAELYAKDNGCCRGKGGSMHMVSTDVGLMGCSAIVASNIPIATGAALASKMEGGKRVIAADFGDGAVDEGVFFESLNFAALKKLPILFVCENNNYAVNSPLSTRHLTTELFRFGEALGVPGERFDGDDVSVVYESVRKAAASARAGGGPRLLEYVTYRRHEHVGPGLDHQAPYRDREKLARAMKRDPLDVARAMVVERCGVTAAQLDEWEAETKRDIDAAVAFAEAGAPPRPEQLLDDVYTGASA
ncbi:MAG TPA: thiamine pyrophosphate-dependent dehydrogenase E1 component subunit alpha [Elusimicrobiota bacterium]|nr:thiamine pyrophosphate-dependent dehydrogenase E1 component subunit alpha [Elusimicrobiota bacterium]